MTKARSAIGKPPLRRISQSFSIGEKVVFKAEPSVHKGLYFRRFHGSVGVIQGKRGDAYEVSIKEGKKDKMLIVNPVHMVRI